MKWHYDLNHAEPIIRDEWLQDGQGSGGYVNSVTMNAGALVCQGTAEQITITACGAEYTAKLAYSNTINSSATNCLGVLLFPKKLLFCVFPRMPRMLSFKKINLIFHRFFLPEHF